MRLTLRTLLAYRDRVLKPGELEDMHARVQQSVLASNLIKRIDSLSQRSNLLAPPIEGKGLGADANSIAEYLDDTLSGEKVPELERICLESDVQLAELAQCHQLLSEGLSATVDVPQELRQRIVALSDPEARQIAARQRDSRTQTELEAPPQAKPHRHVQRSASSTRDDQDARTSASNKASVKNSRFRTDPAHAESSDADDQATGHSVAAAVTTKAVASPMVTSGGDSIRTRGLDLEGAHLAHEVPEYLRGRSRDGWLGPLAIGGLLAVLFLLVWLSVGSWDSVRDMLVMKPAPAQPNENLVNEKPAAAAVNKVPNNKDVASPAGTSRPPIDQAVEPDVLSDLSAVPGLALPSTAASNEPSPANASNDKPNAPPAQPVTNGVIQWLPTDAEAMQAVILVQSDRSLRRLMPAQEIASGAPIFVPPYYRPKLELKGGLTWSVAGMSHLVATTPATSSDSMQVNLIIGRAVLSASRDAKLELSTPAGSTTLQLPDAASQVAIQLDYPAVAHGAVTDRQAHPATLFLMSLAGQVKLDFAGTSIELSPGQALAISGSQVAQSQPQSFPAWVDAANDRPIDIAAAGDLAAQLTEDTPTGAKLIELVSHRRSEMRALAAQTLALLGSWEWITHPKCCLNSSRDRAGWTRVLNATRQVLAAHPENEPALQAALEALDMPAASWRLEMWRGLSKAQLQSDGLAKLAKSLESDVLIERVLAQYQLQRVTSKDIQYAVEDGDRSAAQSWSRDIAAGRIQVLDTPRGEPGLP